jgi:hypothetical protein
MLAILGRRCRFERMKQASGGGGNLVDCRQEQAFVGLRRLVQAADFSDVLERGGAISCGVTGGSKLKSVLIFLHI